MKIYIACPMTGFENFNRPKIKAKAEQLEALGHTPVHTADLPDGWEYMEYINESMRRLITCEAIYLMTGWESSKGVQMYELPLALDMGLKIYKEGIEEVDQ